MLVPLLVREDEERLFIVYSARKVVLEVGKYESRRKHL